MTSADGGLGYDTVDSMILDQPVAARDDDNVIGPYFYPCQSLNGPAGYFGEYIGGAFRDPLTRLVVGTWGDSRESCLAQNSVQTFHQHVFSGRTGS